MNDDVLIKLGLDDNTVFSESENIHMSIYFEYVKNGFIILKVISCVHSKDCARVYCQIKIYGRFNTKSDTV